MNAILYSYPLLTFLSLYLNYYLCLEKIVVGLLGNSLLHLMNNEYDKSYYTKVYFPTG